MDFKTLKRAMQRKGSVFIWFVLFFILTFSLPVSHAQEGRQILIKRCGQCHGLTLKGKCLAGKCRGKGGRAYAITQRPWDLVVPWMRAMGCEMTDDEQKVITRYLMKNYGKVYPIHWDFAGTVDQGWNVVALAEFRGELYAGIEGNGSVFRQEDGPSWKPALTTPNYTVYGLVEFQGKLFAATNDPAGEIWSSKDGKKWNLSKSLPGEKGVISLGVYKGFLYAGTARTAIYRSKDGVTWSMVGQLVPEAKPSFTNWVRFLLPFNEWFYAGVERQGIFRSRDGVSWEPVASIGKKEGVRGAAIFKESLYIGTTTSGEVWSLSSEEGASWVRKFPMDPKTRSRYVASMTVFNGYLYAGTGGKVVRSEDGQFWEEVGQLGPFTIEAMGEYKNSLYAGTTLPPNAWIYRTTGENPVERGKHIPGIEQSMFAEEKAGDKKTPPSPSVKVGEEISIVVREKDEEEDPVGAWDGKNFLVVWQSTRVGRTRIHANQVSPAGKVLQPGGVPISNGPEDQLFPMLVWGEKNFLVVWQDLRSRKQWEIFGAQVNGKGEVVGKKDIVVSAGKGNRKYPAVASNGEGFLAVWMEERPDAGWDVRGTRITTDGKVLNPNGFAIGHGKGDQAHPMVTSTGKSYLVVWMDSRSGAGQDIYGARVDEKGKVLDPEGIPIAVAPHEQIRPAVTWNEEVAVVVWVDRRKGAQYALYGARVGETGKVLDGEGVALSTFPRLHMFPDIACRKEECLVIWEQHVPTETKTRSIMDIVRDVKVLKLEVPKSPSRPLLASAPVDVAPRAFGNHFSKVSTDGERYLTVWKDYRSGIAAGFGRFVEIP